MYVWLNTEAQFVLPLLQWKTIGITYPESVFIAFGIQHTLLMRHIVMWLGQLYNIFPNYPINSMLFGEGEKKTLLNIQCVLICSITFVWNISYSKKTEHIMIINVYCSSCKVSIVLSDFKKLEFSWQIFKNILKYQSSWKSVQWELSCSMWTERQTWQR